MTGRQHGAWRAMPLLAALLLAGPAAAQDSGGSKRPPAPGGGTARCEPARLALRPADAATLPPLRPDRALCIRLQRGQDAYFRVASEAGSTYVVSTRNLLRDSDSVLAALDAQGRVLQENDDDASGGEDFASRIEIGPEHRVALLRVGTLERQGGQFELLLVREAPRPPPNFPTSLVAARDAPPLAEGSVTTLNLRRNQNAFFRLPPDRTGLVAGTGNLEGSTDTVLALLDADGAEVAQDDDGGRGFASLLPLDLAPPGAAFLRVSTLDNAGGRFDLALRREAPPPPPDFPTTPQAAREAGPVAADLVRQLTLGRRQVAVFALPPEPLTALTRDLRANTDTVLALLDADGQVLLEDDDGGGGYASRLSTTRAGGGAAFLRVSTLDGRGGRFELVLRPAGGGPGAPAGPAGTIADAARRPTLLPGESTELQLEPGQAAIYGLPQDGRAAVALTYDLAEGADTVLELLDADGTVLDQNDDAGGLASRLRIEAAPRPAYLRATIAGGGAGRFTLVLVRAAGG